MTAQKEQILEFAEIFNDLETYPTLADVAIALGKSIQTVKNCASLYRRMAWDDDALPHILDRQKHRLTPLSEVEEKHRDAGAKECIEELRRIQSLEPARHITRNYFRHHSIFADSVWSRHFGSFEEFRRQAGLELSRPQHQLERHIARHASVDHYRRFSQQRKGWGEAYLREKDGRFKTAIVGSDFHDHEIDPFFLEVFIDTCARAQPDVIILGGDIFDLPEFGKYGVDPREWDVVGRIRFVHERILRPVREVCPETQIDFIEGNHEARLLKHLADASPAIRVVLSDLHGMTVPQLLGLSEFEVNYIAKADLGAWGKRDQSKELERNYKIYWDSFLVHHFPHARHMGLPGFNGHHHQHVVWSMHNAIYGAYEWHQLGCGHERRAPYCEGEKWNNGFAIAHVDTHTRATNIEYVPVSDFAVVGGRWYRRNNPVE